MQPSIFVSHGAPDLLISDDSILAFFRNFGLAHPAPKAIIVVSAHWVSTTVKIASQAEYDLIYDFSGFADELYQTNYPAKGDTILANHLKSRLANLGVAVQCTFNRGLDHGAWVPLKVIYPDANIPIIAISLPDQWDNCIVLGDFLGTLRKEGIMVLCSGGSVHNLRDLNRQGVTEAWAKTFTQHLTTAVEHGGTEKLQELMTAEPLLSRAHPTLEHLTPLLVAAAAGQGCPGRLVYDSYTYGNLGMACYQF